MAAAEARAAWQRANRCFVQEDAKRAPKLASRQPSTTSSKHADSAPVVATDCLDHPPLGSTPFDGTPYSNLPPDANWWLQHGLNAEHLDDRKLDFNIDPRPPDTIENLPPNSINSVNDELLDSFLDMKKHYELTDYYELLEMEMDGGSVSEQPSNISSSADSSWRSGDNKVPWWRVTDEEELVSFVAHKSHLRVENCDLPPPQKTRVRREHDEIVMGSLGPEAQSEAISTPSSDGSQRRHWSSVTELSWNENVFNDPLRSNNDDTFEKGNTSVNDPAQAKLLEALCYSQTRAREAEKAAKQAHTEKAHILKLFFRQASQLFAYKQWFKLLQLENLLLQSENNISSPFPSLSKKKPRKTWQKPSKAKRSKRRLCRSGFGKYAVAFTVGFSLVGAGLILGWTVGWLLPSF